MANYVNVILDKEDGKLKAIPGALGGGGDNKSYTHEQTVPATVWTVVHGKNSLNLIYQVHDSSREQIIPDSFKVINNNVVEVTFGVPQTGFLQLVVF